MGEEVVTQGVNTVPIKVDARNRAWRTFLNNVFVDIAIVAAPILYGAVTSADFTFTRAYWIPVLVSLGKTAATVVIAYLMRLKKAPVGATTP